jgi:hypothetical protein
VSTGESVLTLESGSTQRPGRNESTAPAVSGLDRLTPPPYSARAERFGTAYADPGSQPGRRGAARRERFKAAGFVSGVDPYSEVGTDGQAD